MTDGRRGGRRTAKDTKLEEDRKKEESTEERETEAEVRETQKKGG